MKKKYIYNIILFILIVLAITISTIIGYKIFFNMKNEKDLEEALTYTKQVLPNIDNTEDNNIVEDNNLQFKGYNVEGIIRIPKIDIEYPILDKTNETTMKLSVTKFWGNNIDDIGNYTIAGHNNKDGTMFGKAKKLEIGDTIEITNLNNVTIKYEIFDIYSTNPNDVKCVESVDKDSREVTLITCTNGHNNRLITKAREIK